MRRRSVPRCRLKCVKSDSKIEENHLKMEYLISMLEKKNKVIDISERTGQSVSVMTKIKEESDTNTGGWRGGKYASDNFERSEKNLNGHRLQRQSMLILEVLMEMIIPFYNGVIIDQGVNAGSIHHIYKMKLI